VPDEENGPEGASPPARSFGLDRFLLLLAVFSAALVFWLPAAGTVLQHWNVIGAGHDAVALLRKLGLWSCLACMAASWLLEREKEEGGHPAIVFGVLVILLFFAAWAIETLVPFEGWWQALRLIPSVVYGGLAYAFLVEGAGTHRGPPPDDEAA
jgi:hypothetical protein